MAASRLGLSFGRILYGEPGHFAGKCSCGDECMVDQALPGMAARPVACGGGMRRALRRKSTIAFLMTLPLILLIALLVLYPALYSVHLATLNKSMQRFVGLSN